MDNSPRELLLNHLRKNEPVCIIDEYVEHIKKYILSGLIENMVRSVPFTILNIWKTPSSVPSEASEMSALIRL